MHTHLLTASKRLEPWAAPAVQHSPWPQAPASTTDLDPRRAQTQAAAGRHVSAATAGAAVGAAGPGAVEAPAEVAVGIDVEVGVAEGAGAPATAPSYGDQGAVVVAADGE